MHQYSSTVRFLLFVFLLATGLAGAAQDSIVARIKTMEIQFSAMVEKNDVAGLDQLLHSRFSSQSPDGFFAKKETLLQRFAAGGNRYQKFKPQIDSIVVLNETLVITSGKEVYVQKREDQLQREDTRFFYHVWLKEAGTWMLAGRVIAAIPVKQ